MDVDQLFLSGKKIERDSQGFTEEVSNGKLCSLVIYNCNSEDMGLRAVGLVNLRRLF